MATVNSDHEVVHVVFLPFVMASHMIPLVDTATLFARQGIQATIITTPYNTLLFKSSINKDIKSGVHQIFIKTLDFPSSEVDLPEGIENFSTGNSPEMASKVVQGFALLQKPMETLIREIRPHCIFSDMFFPWTVDVAKELKIPRIMFYPANCFHQCATHCLKLYTPHTKVTSDSEHFEIPGLPDKIEMQRSQLEDHLKMKTSYGEWRDQISESEKRSYGIVHNTCHELEPAYAEMFKNINGKKTWYLGPLFHFFEKEKVCNVPKSNPDELHSCLTWLDTQKSNSVLYICFGSMVTFCDAQLTDMAKAMEASKIQFIWVIRKREKTKEQESEQQEKWLPLGFEERVQNSNKGLIIRGWAPQVSILQHQAIGGFLTHCGWNSVLEAIVAGVPLITWPLFAENFYTEKLLELLGVSVKVGAEVWNFGFTISSPVIERDEIEAAIRRLMCDSDESKQIKIRVKRVAEMVKGAVEEGGSSYNDLMDLIEDIKCCAFKESS